MKRLVKKCYDNSLDESNFVIPGTPLYPQDYFKARDPKLLKERNEKHKNGEYIDFLTLTAPTMTGLNPRLNSISRLRKKANFDNAIQVNGQMYSIFKNPSSKEIRDAKEEGRYKSVRGVIQDDGTIYCWNSDITHGNTELQKLVNTNCFHFNFDGNKWMCDARYKYTAKDFAKLLKDYKSKLENFGKLSGSTIELAFTKDKHDVYDTYENIMKTLDEGGLKQNENVLKLKNYNLDNLVNNLESLSDYVSFDVYEYNDEITDLISQIADGYEYMYGSKDKSGMGQLNSNIQELANVCQTLLKKISKIDEDVVDDISNDLYAILDIVWAIQKETKTANSRLRKIAEFYDGYMTYDEDMYDVFINPTYSEIEKIKKEDPDKGVRGVIYDNGTIIIWPANTLHHQINSKIEKNIDVENCFRFAWEPHHWIIDAHRKYTSSETISLIKKYKDILSRFGDVSYSFNIYYTTDNGLDSFNFKTYEREKEKELEKEKKKSEENTNKEIEQDENQNVEFDFDDLIDSDFYDLKYDPIDIY